MMAKHSEEKQPATREQSKKQNDIPNEKQASRRAGANRIRLIPVWAKLLLVIVLAAVALAAGAMVGYGVIGDGKPTDALKKSTWTHIIDIVNKETP